MRLLLDTHVFIWAVTANRRLKPAQRAWLESAEEIHVSSASIWEVAIKAQLGKIDADADELAAAITNSGFVELAVTARHAAAVSRLPLHHGDPFDRILVAQAFTEPLRLVTVDRLLCAYGPNIDLLPA